MVNALVIEGKACPPEDSQTLQVSVMCLTDTSGTHLIFELLSITPLIIHL